MSVFDGGVELVQDSSDRPAFIYYGIKPRNSSIVIIAGCLRPFQ